jgi:heme A synthase
MAKRRRQNILVGLVAVVALSGLVGITKDIPLAKTVALVASLLLAGYVYLLVQIRKNAQARALRYEWSSRAA